MSFQKKFTEKLLERDYHFAPGLSDGELIGNDSRYISFLKQSGAAVYGVILIKADKSFDYKEVYTRFRSQFFDFASGVNCANAYCVGLFAGDSEDKELNAYCTHDIDDYTLRFNEVMWLVDIGKNKIFVRGSQPDKLIDLSEMVEAAMAESDDSYSPDVEMRTLLQNEIDKRRESIKSNNILCTGALILINIILLAVTYITGGIGTDNMVRMGAISTELIFDYGQYYRIFTAMFLHYGIVHLVSNMLFLYVFGSVIERYYGKAKFLLIYLGAGIAGNIVFIFFSDGIAAGASGAVFGLVGAMLSFSKLIKRSVEGKDTYFMILFAIISICSGMFMEGVGNTAHIGGFIFGLLSGYVLYNKN